MPEQEKNLPRTFCGPDNLINQNNNIQKNSPQKVRDLYSLEQAQNKAKAVKKKTEEIADGEKYDIAQPCQNYPQKRYILIP